MTVQKRKTEFECYRCDGKGWHRERNVAEDCPDCKGTGKFIEEDYIFIDEKKGIAIDGDTLK